MSKKELCKRYIVFIIGLFINSFGVSFITKAALGTSPISSIPYVLSLNFYPTLGQFTIYFSILLIALQILLLGKKFQLISLLQVPVSIAFGYFIDFAMWILVWFAPSTFPGKFLGLFLGCLILGFGVYIEVLANVVMLPGESFVKAVTVRFHTDFGITKICFDASMAVIAGILSFAFFSALNGIGVGTIVAAFLVGFIAKLFGKCFQNVPSILFGNENATKNPEDKSDITNTTEQPYVITIGREYGCGGREIGKIIADTLGIAYYDSDLLKLTAKELGRKEQYVRNNEQRLTGSLLLDLYLQSNSYIAGETEHKKSVFDAEEHIMRKITSQSSCVIVGRLGNVHLKEYKNAFHVFLSGTLEKKILHVAQREQLTAEEAKHKIKKIERERREHCMLVAGIEWGNARYYDLTMNTSKYTTQQAADLIIHLYKIAKENVNGLS